MEDQEPKTRQRSSTLSSLQDRTTDLSNTESTDSGWKSDSYYQENLSGLRYKLRSYLLPFIVGESSLLNSIQQSSRSNLCDLYFAWTANFGSHTFYVLMLPIPLWFGYQELLRDLVFVLGWGIFLTGWLKDYLCLPRPRSPPLHRITMSHYTAQEYGCPSSHSANATSVTLTLLSYMLRGHAPLELGSLLVLFIYYFSLIFGRIYCGMHGFTDLITGSLIGSTCFLVRQYFRTEWDEWVFSESPWVPLFVVLLYILPIYYHPKPLEPCPCFEDSVLFMGVLLGLELANFTFGFHPWVVTGPDGLPQEVPLFVRYVIPYSYGRIGLVKTVLRLTTGVVSILIWKSVSKIVLYKLLTPLFGSLLKTSLDSSKLWVYKNRLGLDVVIRIIIYAGISITAYTLGNSFATIGLGCEFVLEDYI